MADVLNSCETQLNLILYIWSQNCCCEWHFEDTPRGWSCALYKARRQAAINNIGIKHACNLQHHITSARQQSALRALSTLAQAVPGWVDSQTPPGPAPSAAHKANTRGPLGQVQPASNAYVPKIANAQMQREGAATREKMQFITMQQQTTSLIVRSIRRKTMLNADIT